VHENGGPRAAVFVWARHESVWITPEATGFPGYFPALGSVRRCWDFKKTAATESREQPGGGVFLGWKGGKSSLWDA